MNKKAWLENLLRQPSSYWIHLMNKYFTNSPHVIVKGIPSKQEASRIQEMEEVRTQSRVDTLKEQGLKALENKVVEATRINDVCTNCTYNFFMRLAEYRGFNFKKFLKKKPLASSKP